jgi:hypothetical protein
MVAGLCPSGRQPPALALCVLAARARAWLSPSSVCPDRFLMLLEAVIVILKIRNGFVLGSFFGKSYCYNYLRGYGAISFFVLIALSDRPSCLLRPSGSVVRPLSAPNFSNVSSRNFLINLAVDCIHLEHRGALFPVRSYALITHCHEKNLTLQP